MIEGIPCPLLGKWPWVCVTLELTECWAFKLVWREYSWDFLSLGPVPWFWVGEWGICRLVLLFSFGLALFEMQYIFILEHLENADDHKERKHHCHL